MFVVFGYFVGSDYVCPMPRIKKIASSPLFRLGFLILFLILSLGYLRHNFSARASDESIKLYPQSFSLETNAADLGNPAIKGGSLWQNPEQALNAETDQTADFSAFTEDNSATLVLGAGSLLKVAAPNEENPATSSINDGSDIATTSGAASEESPVGSVPAAPDSVPADQGSVVNPSDSGSSGDAAGSAGSSAGADDLAAPEVPVIQNHLPEANDVSPENSPSQPTDSAPSTSADDSAPSSPAAPAPAAADPGTGDSSDSGPVSLLSNFKIAAGEIGKFWHNLTSASLALAENAIGEATSSPNSDNSSAANPAELKDSIIFSDFNLDSYSPESEITNVQLRLSLSAKTTFNFDHLLVEYSTGGDWQTAGDLFLKGNVSNQANGGYFLYALPIFKSWDDINNLRIRISYQNSELSAADLAGKAAKIYLDGVWLEVDYNQGALTPKSKQELTGLPGAEEHFFNQAPLTTDGKTIDFNYGDTTDGENLIIKTDQQNYTGLTGAPVYFSVTNQGSQTENFGLQTYFPAADGNMTGLEKLSRRAVTAENPTLGDRIYYCAAGWQAASSAITATSSSTQATSSTDQATSSANEATSSTDEANSSALPATDSTNEDASSTAAVTSSAQLYSCPEKNISRKCDSLSNDQKKCQQNQVIIGSSATMENVDQWNASQVNAGQLPDQRNLWQKIWGLGPRRKAVPGDFVPRASSDAGQFSIQPGETEYFKMNISFPIESKGEFYLETVGDKSGYGLLDPWWNASWGYEVPVTVTYAGSNPLSNFQVAVTINTAALITAGKMKSDCSDIAFADTNLYNDASELYYYLEPGTCNKTYTKVWVKIPSITASKTIYLFYGNSSATSYSSGANTFDYFNDFESSVDFNAGLLNPTRTTKAERYGSYGLNGNGGNNSRLETISGSASGRNLIWEAWIKGESSSTISSLAGIAIGHTAGNTTAGYQAVISKVATHYLAITKDYATSTALAFSNTTVIADNTWYFMQLSWRSTNVIWAQVFAGSTTTAPILNCSTTDASYTNGEYGVGVRQIGDWENYRVRKYASSTPSMALGSETTITNHVPANPSSLQQYPLTTSSPIGLGAWTTQSTVNLVATSSDKDSDPFVTYYQLQPSGTGYTTSTSTPTSFCDNNTAYSSCSNKIWANATTTSGWAASSSSYKYRQPIIVQMGQVAGALTSFPIYLDMARLGTSNHFWSNTKRNSDGGDILITNSTGTRLPVEVVAISTSSKTGEVYFKADAISSSSNITFYLYYGSSTASQPASSTTYGARSVWSSGYAAVYHFGNMGTKDSTGQFNGTNSITSGTSTPSAATTTAIMGGARQFYGNSYINLGPSLKLRAQMTLSAWSRPATGNANWAKIIGKMDPTHTAPFIVYGLTYDASNPDLPQVEMTASTTNTQEVTKDTTVPTNNAYFWLAGTYDGAHLLAYYNGLQQGTTAFTNSIADNTQPTELGMAYYGGGGAQTDYYTGVMDEVRIQTVARSGKWLLTEYHNQSSPGTFYSTSSSEDFYLTNSKKAVMIPSVPDSTYPAGYKWESMACDSWGGCSNWAIFNSSLPNFMVDSNAPTFSNTLGLLASTTNSIKLSFPTAATEINFSQYKLYYRLGSTTPIHETDSLWSSSSDGNLGSRTFNGKSSTTITGLATNTVYSFSLWAYDLAGHKASTTLVWERTDRIPTVTFNSAGEKKRRFGKS